LNSSKLTAKYRAVTIITKTGIAFANRNPYTEKTFVCVGVRVLILYYHIVMF